MPAPVHGRLPAGGGRGAAAGRGERRGEGAPAAPAPPRGRPRLALGGLLLAVAAGLLLAFGIVPVRVGATAELDLLIAGAAATGDRTYTIRNLDREPEAADDRRPPIDGATLQTRARRTATS